MFFLFSTCSASSEVPKTENVTVGVEVGSNWEYSCLLSIMCDLLYVRLLKPSCYGQKHLDVCKCNIHVVHVTRMMSGGCKVNGISAVYLPAPVTSPSLIQWQSSQ